MHRQQYSKEVSIIDTTQLLSNYFEWLESNYVIRKHPTSDEIVTPFLDSLNDNISIYVDQLPNHEILLNDDGYTLNNLEMMGIIWTSSRKKLLQDICRQFNIKIIEEETLAIQGSEIDFPLMKYRLTSAILRINDLVFTKKSNVERMFFDDVLNYFNNNDFGGLPTSLRGQSGVKYSFKYAIPKRGHNPLRLIDIQNNISTNQVMLNAFKFGDIKNNHAFHYPNIDYIIIYNDQEKTVSDQAQQIAEGYHLQLIPWKNKQLIDQIKD